MYIFVSRKFEAVKKWGNRLIVGGVLLGIMIFLVPSLYGEGYSGINNALNGNYDYLFEGSLYFELKDSILVLIGVISFLILFKVVATSVTFSSGGVGGIFAPTLFMGAHAGLLPGPPRPLP